MSEPDKVENRLTDSQDTCCDKLEKDNGIENNKGTDVNESQDFCLVDLPDEGGFEESQNSVETSKQEEKTDGFLSSNAEVPETSKTPEPITPGNETSSVMINDLAAEKDVVQESELSKLPETAGTSTPTCNSKDDQTCSIDSDDIIDCTPNAISPSKLQGLGNMETTRLKRKAGSFDEPPSKILRTMSREDMHIIIAETQDTESIHNDESDTVEKKNGVESTEDKEVDPKQTDAETISSEPTIQCPSDIKPANSLKSRLSVELIYDRTATAQEAKSKPKELVEIDEDGEEVILVSFEEDSESKGENNRVLDHSKTDTTYKSCYDSKSSSDFSYKSLSSNTKESSSIESSKSDGKLVNGSRESKRCDTSSTTSLQSDTLVDIPAVLEKMESNVAIPVHSTNKQEKMMASISKDSDHADLLSVSQTEPNLSIPDENKSKSGTAHSTTLTKGLQVEKEIGIYVRMKCLLQIDEGTKELFQKEVMSVHCEAIGEPTLITRMKNNDTSSSLADISGNDNKESSPGSVNSNPVQYQLNPSRLSFASTISSFSSASSAASLAAKLAKRDGTHFSLPRVPMKHVKKHSHELPLLADKQSIDENYERLSKEWQNSRLLTASILNFANAELNGTEACNVSNERIEEQLPKMRSSTPETRQDVTHSVTPKSTKKGKAVKRSRSKSVRSDSHSNELSNIPTKILITEGNNSVVDTPTNSSMQDVLGDELIGKEVFAKWSDNNYYPGRVTDKVRGKYKVNFYDGLSKTLKADFVIPIPETLTKGMSVYSTTLNDDRGSSGIITDVLTLNNVVHYVIRTDEGDKNKVPIKNIFLSPDQAQILREETTSDNKSFTGTPKHLSHVTLDNIVDGKRHSSRITTPIFSTPKSRLGARTPRSKSIQEPSVSGMASKLKKDKKVSSDSESFCSDTNVVVKEEIALNGVQPEIVGTPNEQNVKGPRNRIKGKSRNKKKSDDPETITTLGPIPQDNSTLFKGMSFILTCVSLEQIEKYQNDNKDYGSDPGTENEEEWAKKPFVRDRLRMQITAGSGKVYSEFNEVPREEYKNTKLITNVPNTTAKTLLCLSVGIPAYNHNWIIRCCQEDKIVSPAEDELPAGWSLEKQSYIEMFQRPSNKPLSEVVVLIPSAEPEKQFTAFWRQICENAGAVVLLADNAEIMEGFTKGTIVLTNNRCPTWALERADTLQLPLLSTTWVVQCLIEGKLCSYSLPQYRYNYIKN